VFWSWRLLFQRSITQGRLFDSVSGQWEPDKGQYSLKVMVMSIVTAYLLQLEEKRSPSRRFRLELA